MEVAANLVGAADAHEQTVRKQGTLDTLEDLTLNFQNAMQKGMEGLIEAGKVLIRAKSQLKHGQWENWVIRTLRFGKRKRNGAADVREAQELMLLARHPVISEPNNFRFLPLSRRTLIELAHVPEENLLEHIKTGVINAAMTRSDAVKLKPHAPNENPRNPEPAPVLQESIKVLMDTCLNFSSSDIILAYIRSLNRNPGLPSKEDFDHAVESVHEIYESRESR